MSATSLTVDQAKQELESLMTEALAVEDEKEMENMFHLIVDKSNNLRQRYGIPTQAVHQEPLLVLKTPTEQMQAAGVCDDTVMGHAVFARACAAEKDSICLFDQCFTRKDLATRFTELALKQAKQHMHRHPVRLFPPLLLRARKDELLAIHLEDNGTVNIAPREADRNILFVLFEEGPIIPIIRDDHQERSKRMIQVLYGLQGAIDANTLGSILVSPAQK